MSSSCVISLISQGFGLIPSRLKNDHISVYEIGFTPIPLLRVLCKRRNQIHACSQLSGSSTKSLNSGGLTPVIRSTDNSSSRREPPVEFLDDRTNSCLAYFRVCSKSSLSKVDQSFAFLQNLITNPRMLHEDTLGVFRCESNFFTTFSNTTPRDDTNCSSIC